MVVCELCGIVVNIAHRLFLIKEYILYISVCVKCFNQVQYIRYLLK